MQRSFNLEALVSWQRVQGRTQVSVHVSKQDAAPEGCQVGIVDRWRQGYRPGAPAKGVAGPAQQVTPWLCSSADCLSLRPWTNFIDTLDSSVTGAGYVGCCEHPDARLKCLCLQQQSRISKHGSSASSQARKIALDRTGRPKDPLRITIGDNPAAP